MKNNCRQNLANMFINLYNQMKLDREEAILKIIKSDAMNFKDVLVLGGARGIFLGKVREVLTVENISTIEIDDDCVAQLKADQRNVVHKADLNKKFPFSDTSFDLIVADQVIEHIIDVDSFLFEIHRVLKNGGKAIISTENLSSFANVMSLILGYRPFSMHYSYRINVGNPFSSYANKKINSGEYITGMIHHKIFTPRSLEELLKFYNFTIVGKYFNGFMPLPNFLAKIFKKHSFFMSQVI